LLLFFLLFHIMQVSGAYLDTANRQTSASAVTSTLEIDPKHLADTELLRLRVQLDIEIAARGLTLNVGELGERLAIKVCNDTPGLPKLVSAPRGAKNVDALSRDGDRYSIKTVLKAKKTSTVYPDQGDREKQLFEYMLIVSLNPDYRLKAIYRLSWASFLSARAWDKRMNAWYVPISAGKLALAERFFSEDGSAVV
jgi:hypothetical protein